MINPDTGQPYTRRELREREKNGPVAVESAPEPIPTPAENSVVVSAVESAARSDIPTFWPEAPVLTRRQRREQEQAAATKPATPPPPIGGADAPRVPSASEVTRELADLSETTSTDPAPPDEPLPPVFAPVVNSAPSERPAPSVELSRGPGDPLRATSSLIIPTAPGTDFTGPLGDTGEIVVTGNIRLPAQLSTQGTAPFRLDSEADDEVMDAYVTGEIGALSQPVSARHAVSGRSKDSEILSVRKTRWGTGTIVTLLVLGTLTLAAVGLVVLSLTTGVLL